MPVFSQIEHQTPPDVVVVSPFAFASTWAERPAEDVTIGLRLIPDPDLEDARIEAYRRADRLFPNHEKTAAASQLFVATFQDTLVRWVIARGTCDPNNVHKPWEGWEVATEDIVVEQALTDHGAQLIFDAWERMRIACNIGLPPATDDDLALLPGMLTRLLPALTASSATQALRVRRLLRFVLEELEAVDAPTSPTGPKDPLRPAPAEQTTLPRAP